MTGGNPPASSFSVLKTTTNRLWRLYFLHFNGLHTDTHAHRPILSDLQTQVPALCPTNLANQISSLLEVCANMQFSKYCQWLSSRLKQNFTIILIRGKVKDRQQQGHMCTLQESTTGSTHSQHILPKYQYVLPACNFSEISVKGRCIFTLHVYPKLTCTQTHTSRFKQLVSLPLTAQPRALQAWMQLF